LGGRWELQTRRRAAGDTAAAAGQADTGLTAPPATPAEPFALAQQTEDDVRQQEADRRRQEAEREQEAAEQARRDAAPPADDFVLSGSDRPADQAAARGQMELTPAAPETFVPAPDGATGKDGAALGREIAKARPFEGPRGEYRLDEKQPFRAQEGGYETDLFGDPLPRPAGSDRRARSGRAGVSRDVQPAAEVQGTEAPRGDYLVRTIVGTEARRTLGASRIKTADDAARATKYLYRSAVERFDGIVTDADGKPLAVVGGFKGALSQASVYPSTLVAEAMGVPGAARIWFSHNHPSGTADLSAADRRLHASLNTVFRGSGIEPMGLLAIGGDKYAFQGVTDPGSALSGYDDDYDANLPIPRSDERHDVPVIERSLVPAETARPAIHSPADARNIAAIYYGRAKEPGLILLDSQHYVAGWVPLSNEMQGRLRGTGGLRSLYRAVSESTASAVIIAHGGELDALPAIQGVPVIENIGAALRQVDVTPLDAINMATGKSRAEQGSQLASGPVFSRKPNEMRALARSARSKANERMTVELGTVSSEQAAVVAETIGVDVSGFSHTADTYAVRHAINQHGSAEKEARRGQIAITDDDLAAVPAILAAPDALVLGAKNNRGQDIIGYIGRRADGSVLYVEEVRTGRKTLAMASLRKVPAARDFDSIARTLLSNARSDGGEPIVVRMDSAGNAEPAASRGASASGLPAPAVTRIANAIRAAWANPPEVVVVTGMDDSQVPQAVRDYDAEQRSQGAVGAPEGFFYDGKVYLDASQLATPADVVRVLAHEALGHYGLRGLFGDRLAGILDQIVAVRRAEVEAKRREYRLPDTVAGRRVAAEEVLAGMAQTNPQMGFVRRAVAAIRSWLRGLGVNLRMTDDEIIRNFIIPARQWVERGGRPGTGMPAFSRGGDGRPSAAKPSASSRTPSAPSAAGTPGSAPVMPAGRCSATASGCGCARRRSRRGSGIGRRFGPSNGWTRWSRYLSRCRTNGCDWTRRRCVRALPMRWTLRCYGRRGSITLSLAASTLVARGRTRRSTRVQIQRSC